MLLRRTCICYKIPRHMQSCVPDQSFTSLAAARSMLRPREDMRGLFDFRTKCIRASRAASAQRRPVLWSSLILLLVGACQWCAPLPLHLGGPFGWPRIHDVGG